MGRSSALTPIASTLPTPTRPADARPGDATAGGRWPAALLWLCAWLGAGLATGAGVGLVARAAFGTAVLDGAGEVAVASVLVGCVLAGAVIGLSCASRLLRAADE